MNPGTERHVDELRQQLRALGYLDAGVDRFVLGGARDTGGPIATAARASLRVGLLGGALLGPAAALGLQARLPELIRGLRDAIVLAIYFAIFFLAAVAIASFVVSIASAAFARTGGAQFPARARRASRSAAWVFTIGSLLYLTLWWRNANAGFGWSAPVWTTFALGVAVAISLLLGHAVRVATLAVLAVLAPKGAGTALPPVSARSWRVALGGGALAFVGASTLLLMTVRTDADAASSAPHLAVVGSKAPIRLVALDGFDPGTFERLKDRLPNLKAVFSGRHLQLQPQDTSDPARAWTTIATGVAPETHGVHAIETRRVAGLRGAVTGGSGSLRVVGIATDLLRLTRPALASSQDRKVKTLWEVADSAGLRTAVINWWATWPAPAGDGLLITDRGVLRLQHSGALDGEIAPASLYDALRPAWPAIRERATVTASSTFTDVTDPAIAATLRRSAELDATLIALLGALPPPARDLDVIYLPGLDIAQNSLLGSSAAATASSAASRVEALEKYYVFLDAAIAPLLVSPDHATTVVIVTQPGRVPSSAGGLLALWSSSAGYDQQTRGGGGTGTSSSSVARLDTPSPIDVAPTLLYALGIPLSRELAGTARPGLFDDSSHAADRFVATYGRPFVGSVASAGKPLDQEMIDRLRSLGYVK